MKKSVVPQPVSSDAQMIMTLKRLTEALEKNNLLREKQLKIEEKRLLLERKNGKTDSI